MTTLLRRAFLIGMPLVLAAVLWYHPDGGEDDVFDGLTHDVDMWLTVHTAFLFFIPLMAIAVYVLLGPLQGRAATVSRLSLIPFICFYTAYEVTIGLGAGLLVDYANSLPPDEQAVVAGAIQDYTSSDLLGDPMSVALALGLLGWVVSLVAAAVAFRRAGAGWTVTALVGLSALFAIHPPPIGPAALVCFAAAAALVERQRARDARAVVAPGGEPEAPAALATP